MNTNLNLNRRDTGLLARRPRSGVLRYQCQPRGPGYDHRSRMQNQNPYEAPATSDGLPRKSGSTRYRFSALAFTAVAVLMALLYFPVTIRYVFETGNIQNNWIGLLLHLCILAIASFFMIVEFIGNARSMRFLPIPLGLLMLVTLLIAFGFFRTISNYFFSLTWIFQNPHTLLFWLMCPIVWYYSFQCFMRRREIREQISGEP